MPEDILAELRAREEEMEALINEARKEASRIREEALRSARELKESRRKESEEEARSLEAAGSEAAGKEAMMIVEEGEKEAGELRGKGDRNIEKAVSEVVRFLKSPKGVLR